MFPFSCKQASPLLRHTGITVATTERMIFDNFLCLIVVLSLIAFVIGLTRGFFEIRIKKEENPLTALLRNPVRRPRPRYFNAGYRFDYDIFGYRQNGQRHQHQRNRNRGSNRRNAGNSRTTSVLSGNLPTYEDSTRM